MAQDVLICVQKDKFLLHAWKCSATS